MASITLSVSDLDLAAGNYRVDFRAEGNEIDDGQATAAYFTGFYLNTLINTPDFIAGVRNFGQALVDGLLRTQEDRAMTSEPAKMLLTLTDKNAETGRFNVTLQNEGGDPTGESLPTTAQIVACYMRWLLTDADFREKVWAFADEYVASHCGSILANADHHPANYDVPEPAADAA